LKATTTTNDKYTKRKEKEAEWEKKLQLPWGGDQALKHHITICPARRRAAEEICGKEIGSLFVFL
jgi:hypothetical protein